MGVSVEITMSMHIVPHEAAVENYFGVTTDKVPDGILISRGTLTF